MQVPWFLIRAVAILVAGCAITAFMASSVVNLVHRQINASRVGGIARGVKAMTPDVERRDKEVEELTRP